MNLNDGKIISDIVQAALDSGDFSKLRDLGPALKDALNSMAPPASQPNSSRNYPRSPQRQPYHNNSRGNQQGSPRGYSYNNRPQAGSPPGRYPNGPGSPGSLQPTGSVVYPNRPIGSGQALNASAAGQARPAGAAGAMGSAGAAGAAGQARPGVLASRPPQAPRVWQAPPRDIVRISHGIPQIVLSSIGTGVFGFSTMAMISGIASSPEVFIPMTIVSSIPAIASLILLINGINKNKLSTRVLRLANLFYRKNVYTFDELAAETGFSPKQIKKDLKKARAKGQLPMMRFDEDETCVMWGEEPYKQYLATREAHLLRANEAEERQRRLADPQTADIERFRAEGQAALQQIHAANATIAGETITTKLDDLEDTIARIFIYVEKYPEKLPDTRKFMSYYLPTTLKLVDKYRQFDALDFQPENVLQAKLDIEYSFDTINMAFSNLLESLFEHETMDVTTDINVLKQMLEQEGLTNSRFEIDSSSSFAAYSSSPADSAASISSDFAGPAAGGSGDFADASAGGSSDPAGPAAGVSSEAPDLNTDTSSTQPVLFADIEDDPPGLYE